MDAWIPLMQSLVWPLFVGLLLVWFRDSARGIVEAIRARIEGGDELEAGTSGIKLGSSRSRNSDKGEVGLTSIASKAAPPGMLAQTAEAPAGSNPEKTAFHTDLPHDIYMVHKAKRDRALDQGGNQYYRLKISLDADVPEILDRVSKVVYHLHPTFANPDREVKDRGDNFELTTAAWGQFNMAADVHFKDGTTPLTIERYISF